MFTEKARASEKNSCPPKLRCYNLSNRRQPLVGIDLSITVDDQALMARYVIDQFPEPSSTIFVVSSSYKKSIKFQNATVKKTLRFNLDKFELVHKHEIKHSLECWLAFIKWDK